MLERVLRRDRAVVLGALLALTAVAWAYLLTATMREPANMAMPAMLPVAGTLALVRELFFAFAMWTVMMVGMMTPSAAPLILVYARLSRVAAAQGDTFAPAGYLAAGYFFAWTRVALLAALAQILLVRHGLLTPMLAGASPVLNGVLLFASGAYQFTLLKDLCLTQCRSPLLFVQNNGGFRGTFAGTLSLGFKHGLYCVGCCWALMLLLFGGGVMNLAWVAGLTALVFLEKILPQGRALSRVTGLVLVIAGLIVLGNAWL